MQAKRWTMRSPTCRARLTSAPPGSLPNRCRPSASTRFTSDSFFRTWWEMPSNTAVPAARALCTSARKGRTGFGSLACATTASVSNRNTGSKFLDCLHGCRAAAPTPGRASAWLSASELSSVTTDAYGSNRNPEQDRTSASRSPSDPAHPSKRQIVVVEDSRADAWLIRLALTKANIDADIVVIEDGEKAI